MIFPMITRLDVSFYCINNIRNGPWADDGSTGTITIIICETIGRGSLSDSRAMPHRHFPGRKADG